MYKQKNMKKEKRRKHNHLDIIEKVKKTHQGTEKNKRNQKEGTCRFRISRQRGRKNRQYNNYDVNITDRYK